MFLIQIQSQIRSFNNQFRQILIVTDADADEDAARDLILLNDEWTNYVMQWLMESRSQGSVVVSQP